MINWKKLPTKPGVYLFKNNLGETIYIGKALSIKKRIAGYFQKGLKESKTEKLLSQIKSIDYFLVNSEFEALLLEAKLIKQYKPKFNTRLKDNKSYLYIAISKEPLPRLYVVRRPELEEKILDWYGPFPSAKDTRQVLRIIRKIFPFRSCRILPHSPCLYYHLKLCPGACYQPAKNYPETIKRIKQILSGKTPILIKNLAKKMRKAAEKTDFEEAQKIKSQITALKNITQGWKTIPEESRTLSKTIERLRKLIIKYSKIDPIIIRKIEGFDVSNLGEKIIVGSMVSFVNGQPEKSLYRKFNIKNYRRNRRLKCNQQNDPLSLKQVIQRRLKHPEWIYPQLILVDGGKPQISTVFKVLKENNLENQIAILGLAKKEEIIVMPKIFQGKIVGWKLLKFSPNSPVLQLLQQIRDESHRFAQNYYKLLYKKLTFSIFR